MQRIQNQYERYLHEFTTHPIKAATAVIDMLAKHPRATIPAVIAAFAIRNYVTSGTPIPAFMATAASTLTNTSALNEISIDFATMAASALKEASTNFTIGILSSYATLAISSDLMEIMGATVNSNMGAHTYTLDLTRMQNHWVYNDSKAILGTFAFISGISGCAAFLGIRFVGLAKSHLIEQLRFF